jgi:hypothetical protein
MDKLLKLKLEILYKDLPIEQARQTFEQIKQESLPKEQAPPKKRKLRIPASESK